MYNDFTRVESVKSMQTSFQKDSKDEIRKEILFSFFFYSFLPFQLFSSFIFFYSFLTYCGAKHGAGSFFLRELLICLQQNEYCHYIDFKKST